MSCVTFVSKALSTWRKTQLEYFCENLKLINIARGKFIPISMTLAAVINIGRVNLLTDRSCSLPEINRSKDAFIQKMLLSSINLLLKICSKLLSSAETKS